MKIIRNNIIPFPGFKAINLFGVLFVKNNAKIDDVTINHEDTFTAFVELMDSFAVATVHDGGFRYLHAFRFLRVVYC